MMRGPMLGHRHRHDKKDKPLAKHSKVLIVDDDPAMRDLLSELIERQGCCALTARSGESGWMVAVNTIPDLIIVDYSMDNLDGAALIRRIRSAPYPDLRKVPIIGLSGVDGSDTAMLAAGATEFVQKPMISTPLIAAIHRYVTCKPC